MVVVAGDGSEFAGEAARTLIKQKRCYLNNYHYHFALHLNFLNKSSLLQQENEQR
jgi:hypothetical protein